MRRTVQLILPLAISVICISLFYTAHQVRVERRNLRDDLSRRSAVLAESLQERLEPFNGRIGDTNLNRIVQRVREERGHDIRFTRGLCDETCTG
jgi:hypothetical protein